MSDYLLDGVLLRPEAHALGIDDRALTDGVRSGDLVRVRHGAYAGRRHWDSANEVERHEVKIAAVRRKYGPHVVLSHASAGVLYGVPLWNVSLEHVHATHLIGGGRRLAGVAHHRGTCYVDDLRRQHGYWITTPARTALDMALDTGSTEVGIVVASDLLHRGIITTDDLLLARARHEARPGSLAMRAVCAFSDERLESPAEARAWYQFRHLDVPQIIPQYEVRSADGQFIGRADFAIPELGLLIEIDGAGKYTKYLRPGETMEDVLRRERRRENLMREVTGWEVIRLTWYDLEHPEQTLARIRRVIARIMAKKGK